MLKSNEMTGYMMCLQYKYGNKLNLFQTYQECYDAVVKYPVTFEIVPQQFKDKNLVLAFLKANGKYVQEYWDIEEKRWQDEDEAFSNGIFLAPNRGRFTHLHDVAIVEKDVDFGEWTGDVDVLCEIVKTRCPFSFTQDTYHEDAVKKAIAREHKLVSDVYSYWESNICKNQKEIDKVCAKYQLFENRDARTLAFFKCLSLIEKENSMALLQLFVSASWDVDSGTCFQDEDAFKKIFRLLDEDMQVYVVEMLYSYAKYASKKVLDGTLVEEIVKICPIAGDVLPDEYVLRYGLEQALTEEEMEEKCKKCRKCQWSRIRF